MVSRKLLEITKSVFMTKLSNYRVYLTVKKERRQQNKKVHLLTLKPWIGIPKKLGRLPDRGSVPGDAVSALLIVILCCRRVLLMCGCRHQNTAVCCICRSGTGDPPGSFSRSWVLLDDVFTDRERRV